MVSFQVNLLKLCHFPLIWSFSFPQNAKVRFAVVNEYLA